MTYQEIFPSLASIDPSWSDFFEQEMRQDYFSELAEFIKQETGQGKTLFPPKTDTFNAFILTPLDQTRVVILGQDPYHGAGQAMGLAFSVKEGVRIPPSLRNINKELASDMGIETPSHGDLSSWAGQGVLLLNTVLTVEESQAHSHAGKGWEHFTDAAIQQISQQGNTVFLLWGSHAQKKAELIDNERNFILTAPHPSPLSAHRGFLGCQHFSKANARLKQCHRGAIDWSLPAIEQA